MKIIVTGGAGFIGSHIVDSYIHSGHQVLIIDNFSSGKQENINPKAEVVKADINSPDLLSIINDFKPEIINHQAAQINVRTSVDDPAFDANENIIGSIRLLEVARKVGTVKKFLFASSGGAAYGDAQVIPTDESQPTLAISPYGVAKISVEHYLYYYYKVYGIAYTALRYSNVFGPRQNPHGEAGVVAIFYQRILSGQDFKINGDGEQTRDFVFVSDVARANLLATTSEFVGEINIGTSKETSINSLVDQMLRSVDSSLRIEHVEGKAGEQKRSALSYSLAQEKLGWTPEVTVEKGLELSAEFFKNK